MNDIYIRRANVKSRVNDESLETSDKLELFLQQIEITLSTPRNFVMGAPEYGVDLQYFLHSLGTNSNDITNVVKNAIDSYCSLANEFSYRLNVEFFKLDNGDAMTIDIIIEDDNLIRVTVE